MALVGVAGVAGGGTAIVRHRGSKGRTPEADAPTREDERPAAGPGAPAGTEDTTELAPDQSPIAPGTDTGGGPQAAPALERPEKPASRLIRLRERLARSGGFGKGLLALLSRDVIDDATWDDVEETLLLADIGPAATDELLEHLHERVRVLGHRDGESVRALLREELLRLVDPAAPRNLDTEPRTAEDGTRVPAVLVMVGVNGSGKTTTAGKLARVLVAEDRTVVLGAADTFRAAAADQLATWGERVGVPTVRSDREGADPASVAFDAVTRAVDTGADSVIVDTAGRLQNKTNLMEELRKVKRVAEKPLHDESVTEVLLVLDATTGQNGMAQARVFAEVVQITGIVLTKLDGTAKGGIVINVQRELGVPVKLVGLGEGVDDLAPFDPEGFVDGILGS